MPIEHEVKTITVAVSSGELRGGWELDPKEGKDLLNRLEEKYKGTVAECEHKGPQYDFTIEPGSCHPKGDKPGCHQHATYWLCDGCAQEAVSLIKKGKKILKGFEVFYYSKKFDTMKVANRIARTLRSAWTGNVRDVKKLGEKDSVVFLGSESLNGRPGKEMLDFIERNDFRNRKVALFSASVADKGKEMGVMEEMLKKKGAQVIGKFYSRGKKVLFFNANRPSGKDMEDSEEFALKMKELAAGKA